ncbi:MAG: GGDEF domain-containing protein [Congregibacter sp.]
MSDKRMPDAPVTDIEITSLPVVSDTVSLDGREVILRAHVLQCLRQAQRNLLSFKTVSAMVKYLLEDFPASFGSAQGELRLHDPEDALATLLPVRKLFGASFILSKDSYELYKLYPDTPDTSLLTLDDQRMFTILAGAGKAAGAVMMPLFDGNRLIGSYHLALVDGMQDYGEAEREVFAMLGQLIASALLRGVEFQRADQLTMIDPVTEVGNLRAFRRNMHREILWARRVNQPVVLLFIALDELDELCRNQGEVAWHFVQRRVSQRLCSDLRATDYVSHVSTTHFAVVLPSCNEPQGYDIGERMRSDIDEFSIDDGRGAVLHSSLSIGLVCWVPAQHPMKSTERLAMQMESEAEAAMQKAARAGGNRVSVARLGLLML